MNRGESIFQKPNIPQRPGRNSAAHSAFLHGRKESLRGCGQLADGQDGVPEDRLSNEHLTCHLDAPRDTRCVSRGVIRSFADKRTAAIWLDRMPRGFPSDLAKTARRKLRIVAAAMQLEDLRSPPGNRLETLVSDRAGQYSVRVNEQWRLCFV